MGTTVLLIGFGEAGRAIASGWRDAGFNHTVSMYDIKVDDPGTRGGILAAAGSLDVAPVAHKQDAVAGVKHVFSLVTADQALRAAKRSAEILPSGAVFWDMNSVAPGAKRAASKALVAVGVRYLDVGVLSPIHPKRHRSPMAIAGSVDDGITAAVESFGFDTEFLSNKIGDAASLKLLRSIIIKGLESLLVECHTASEKTGQTEKVLQTLAQSFPGIDWPERMDYVLQRVEKHGQRRAAEMAEAVTFLNDIGVPPLMSRASSERLSLGITTPEPPKKR